MLAGIGNVYRAEILFRHQVDPFRAGHHIDPELWQAMWADLVVLMRAGVRTAGSRRCARRTGHASAARCPGRRPDYVYRRTGLPCRVCGTEVATAELVGRNLLAWPPPSHMVCSP